MSRLAVSTDCPACGAPLDFGEGSNAILCGHCRANLLVTGRLRVLSYWIPPRVEAPAARAAARVTAERGGRAYRLGEPRLWLVPHYRMTALELRLERPAEPIEPARPGGTVDRSFAEAALAAAASLGESSTREPVVHDRHLEKTFLAADLGRGVPYSIGVRSSVLRLELFRKSAAEALGTCVAPALSPEEALAIGSRGIAGRGLLRRELVAVRLALVWFPYWTVPIERRGSAEECLVDGVSGSVAAPALERGGLAARARPLATEGTTIGFRPLLCPNCGWDLPLRPDDSVFACGRCSRAWEIDGAELVETPVVAAEAPLGRRTATPRRTPSWLPFWRLGGGIGRLVPAFRFRRAKVLVDLTAAYAKKPPAFTHTAEPPSELVGVYFDRTDARLLARFADGVDAEAADPSGGDSLVWIPFRPDGYSLVDPFTGLGLASRLVL